MANEKGKMLDVSGAKDAENRNVGAYKKHNGKNQQWHIVYEDDYEEWKKNADNKGLIPNKPFRLLSKMRARRALTRTGSKLIIRNKDNSNDQIFVFNESTKSIQPKQDRSVSIDIEDFGKDRTLAFRKNENIWSQHFNLKKEQMVNERGLVFDVAGGKDVNGQKVLVWKTHGSMNQKWIVEYV